MKIIALSSLLLPTAYAESLSRLNSHFEYKVTDELRAKDEEDIDKVNDCLVTVSNEEGSETKITWTCKANIGKVFVEDVKDHYIKEINDAIVSMDPEQSVSDDDYAGVGGESELAMQAGENSARLLQNTTTNVETGVVTVSKADGTLLADDECTFAVTCTISGADGDHGYVLDNGPSNCMAGGGSLHTSRESSLEVLAIKTSGSPVGFTNSSETVAGAYANSTQMCHWSATVEYSAQQISLWFQHGTEASLETAIANSQTAFSVAKSEIVFETHFEQEDLETTNAEDSISGHTSIALNDGLFDIEFGGNGADGTEGTVTQSIVLECGANLDLLADHWHTHDWAAVKTVVTCPSATMTTTAGEAESQVEAIHLIKDYSTRPLELGCAAGYVGVNNAQWASTRPECVSATNSFDPNGAASEERLGVECRNINSDFTFRQIFGGEVCNTEGHSERGDIDQVLQDPGEPVSQCSERQLHAAMIRYEPQDHGFTMLHYMRTNTESGDDITLTYAGEVTAELRSKTDDGSYDALCPTSEPAASPAA